MLGEVLDVKKMIKTLKEAPFDDILVKYQSFLYGMKYSGQISLKCH